MGTSAICDASGGTIDVVVVRHVAKSFHVPTVRRDTVREHVLGALRPRRYDTLDVLDDVSFTLRRGEALGVMGRNGCGKSALLKLVCGIYQPDRGRVEVNGSVTPVLELGVGWNPELDAIDNVRLLGSVMGLSLAQIHRRMDGILAFAELERFANLKLKHYSSGMASRLGYAVAFEAVRDILVVDEIFAVGDAGFQRRCEQRYQELRANGHSVLMVGHAPRIIASWCDRALLLDDGKIVMAGGAREVADRYVELLTSPSSDGSTTAAPATNVA